MRHTKTGKSDIKSSTIEGENHYMSIDSTIATGTIVRLANNNHMGAEVGSLARITGSDDAGMIPVEWIRGLREDTVGTQRDGFYMSTRFEVNEFQIGDRVRVNQGGYESGYEGVITTIPAGNGDECRVDIEDNGLRLSYNFARLTKIEDEIEEVEEEAEVEETVEPASEPAFGSVQETHEHKVGDIMVINVTGPRAEEFEKWNGLRFPLAETTTVLASLFLKNGAIDTRPDGINSDFFWDEKWLRAFDPKTDFRVGDIVEADRYSVNNKPAKGVVTNPYLYIGGDIEVDWLEGPGSLVAYGPLGASRRYLKVVGTSVPRPEPEPEVKSEATDPEPEPVIEATRFAVGDRVRVISDAGDTKATEGALGTVTEADGDLVAVLQDHGVTTYQFEFRFEHTDIAKPEDEALAEFEAGQEIGSADVLDDLPLGTVVYMGRDEASPIVKLYDGRFGRLNRYGLKGSGGYGLLAYDATDQVREAITNGGDSVMIAYVPTVSI